MFCKLFLHFISNLITLHAVTGHVIGRVHSHDPGESHDTGAAIQTILSSLVKQNNESVFSCEEEGSFPHPIHCSRYYLCEQDLEVTLMTNKNDDSSNIRQKSMSASTS